MNIALCTDCYQPTKNGVVTSVVQLKEGLERRGHRVTVVTVDAPGYKEVGGIHCLPSAPFNKTASLYAGWALPVVVRRIFVQEAVVLVHTHTEFGVGWSAKKAAEGLGLPLVHTAHTIYENYRHYLFFGKWISNRLIVGWYRRFLNGYAAVICPSEKMASYLKAQVPDVCTTIIGNGIDRNRFMPDTSADSANRSRREAYGINKTDRVMLYVGRLVPEKRVVELLVSLVPLLDRHSAYRLMLVGDGPERAHLADLAEAHGVIQQVIITGFVDWEALHGLYAAADVFVTASLSDVHPLALIEAAVCGLPIVARYDSGYAGLVEDGYNGYLLDSDERLPSGVVAILQNESRRLSFSQNSLSLSEKHSLDAHVNQVESLYETILKHH